LIVARDLPALRAALAARPGRWALVPTMGALHAGHVALATQARDRARNVAASIFVNPTQFAANEDLSRYPRDEAGDLAKLEAAGCDLVWLPSVQTMYPPGDATFVDMSGPSAGYEGAMRPGHFRGMATVVSKLLLQVGPAYAMFGEKDWQQLQVVRRMVADLHFPVEIVGVPTVREADGLAMSSRNRFLSPAERALAPHLAEILWRTAAALAQGRAGAVAAGGAALEDLGFGVDYFAEVDSASLGPAGEGPTRLIAAARLGAVRLLDNVPVG
jgi:pantoate--beta-alanine ligase